MTEQYVYVLIWDDIGETGDMEETIESTLLGVYTTEAAALTRAQAQAEFFQHPWPDAGDEVNTSVGIRTAYQCDARTILAIYRTPLDPETEP